MSSHYYRFARRGAAEPQRAASLERLLARAEECVTVANWREEAFRVIAPGVDSMPAVAAAALYAERGTVAAESIFLATPVHYVADMSTVRLPANGILSLRGDEARVLEADFNRLWNDAGVRLLAGRHAELFCIFDRPLDAATADPEEVCGGRIENHLPTGTAASRLRGLMSEIEMWLFDHAVNRARAAEAARPLTGLWLWGGGPAVTSLPPVQGWAAGNDPLFRAFAAPQNSLGAPPQPTAPGVIVLAGEPGTNDLESRWLVRSLDDLRAGRITQITLSAGKRCFRVNGRWSWRLVRRRPWWESFA